MRPRGYVARHEASREVYRAADGTHKVRSDGWQVWIYIPSIGGYKALATIFQRRSDARHALRACR